MRKLTAVRVALLTMFALAPVARADTSPLPTISSVSLAPSGGAGAIAIQGDYAYVTTDAALRVVNVYDPAAPVVVGSLTGVRGDVLVHGTYAYVSDGNSLWVIDVTVPSAPVTLRTIAGGGKLAAAWPYLYAARWWDTLDVFDASNPAAPVRVATQSIANVINVAIAGTKLLLTTGYPPALQIFDTASDPVHPQRLSSITLPSSDPGTFNDAAWGVAVSGDYALVTTHGWWDNPNSEIFEPNVGDLHVVDIRYPRCPREVARLSRGSVPEGIAVHGSAAYLVEWDTIGVVDVTNPAAPFDVGRLTLPRPAGAVAAQWRDIDFSRGAAFVPETISYLGGVGEGALLVLREYAQPELPPGGVCLP